MAIKTLMKARIYLIGILTLSLFTASLAGREKYAFVFSPKPEQTLMYNLVTQMNSEGQSFLGKSISLGAQALGRIDLSVRQVVSDRVFTELRTSGIKVSLQSLGQQNEFTLATPADLPVKVVFDKSLRIRELKNVEALEKQNLLNFSVLDIFRNCLPSFPDTPVGIGESWRDHKTMSIPFEGINIAIGIDITFTLDQVIFTSRGRMAFISAVYQVALSGSQKIQAYAAEFQGKGSGSGRLTCLLDQGIFTDYWLDYSVDGAMVLRQAETLLATWPFTLSMAAQLNLIAATSGLSRPC